MDPRVICTIFGFSVLILIIVWICSGGDDDEKIVKKPIEKPKENICKQTEQQFNKQYLVENNLNRLRLNDNYTDIELLSHNQTIRGHKIILASHSRYFYESMQNASSARVSAMERLNIDFIDDKILIAALNYMYMDTIADDLFQNSNNYGPLLRAADQFHMESLKCEISRRLETHINVRNVGTIVALAIETDTKFLKIVAANFIISELENVRKTSEWNAVAQEHTGILTNVLHFQANLPENTTCDIQCEPSSLQSPSVFTWLRQFFIAERFADAEIHVIPKVAGGEKIVIHVNRAILIGQSEPFRKAFGDSYKIDVEFHDVDAEVMNEFLVYMYCGWPTQKMKQNNMPAGLLYLSSIYHMNGLQTACEDILIEKLNIQNAAEIIVVANKANSTRLFKIALDFIVKNRRSVVKTNAWNDLKQNHPEILI